jgi:hypothetical protein
VGPKAGLDNVETRKLLTSTGPELEPLGHSARSQSLYRLSYPGSLGFYTLFLLINLVIDLMVYNKTDATDQYSCLVPSIKELGRGNVRVCLGMIEIYDDALSP